MITDEALAEQIVEGDQAAFEAFVGRYHLPILNHLEHLLKDRTKAEDFLQETFLKFLNQLQKRSIPQNIRAWLYSVATNLCRDYWRSAGYQKERQILEQVPEEWDRMGQVIDIFEHRERRTEILSLLNELPDVQKQIIIMRFYNDLKLQEIASVMACPIGTVKSRLFHALRLLKNRMEEQRNVSYG